ncbi:Uncharacterised protein [Bordetella pertussis]|nr:Uncharacterised protein [Bordetella pertussis]CFO29335.1 Uncharacterised protein [Bordetella pertussis]CFW43582.1 Uncharacterised protein [Bordetella pertussis]CPK41854.1 Uncharacterised protein [Bordetella pertussis]CPO90316.1 Uncharacterised protein [Bordetella pertussis]
MRLSASGVSAALPGSNSMYESSSPPPKAEASSVKGEVTALTTRLTSTRTMMPPTENCGSSSEPEIGRLMSMLPRLSLSSATASSTGSLTASGLSVLSPKVSWLSTTRLLACSARSLIWYCTSSDSLPRLIG